MQQRQRCQPVRLTHRRIDNYYTKRNDGARFAASTKFVQGNSRWRGFSKGYWIFRDFPPRRRDDWFMYIRGNRSSVLDGIFARKNLFPRTINAKLVTLWVVRDENAVMKLRLELFFLSRCTRLWKVLLKWKDLLLYSLYKITCFYCSINVEFIYVEFIYDTLVYLYVNWVSLDAIAVSVSKGNAT